MPFLSGLFSSHIFGYFRSLRSDDSQWQLYGFIHKQKTQKLNEQTVFYQRFVRHADVFCSVPGHTRSGLPLPIILFVVQGTAENGSCGASLEQLRCLKSGVKYLNSYKMSFVSNSAPLLRQLNFLV